MPWLTSIHAFEDRGPYGDARYRGNCSGLLIRDLLLFYKPKRVLDPMAGGGTCLDVCRELNIDCISFDLRGGYNATAPGPFENLAPCDFVWMHPPYWNLIRYSEDPRCLSNSPTLTEFLARMGLVIKNCAGVLSAEGRMAILIGDGKHRGEYLGLPFRLLGVAEALGFWLDAPEIVRFSHGSTSSRKEYQQSFIPRLHDLCLVLKRQEHHDFYRDLQEMPKGEPSATALSEEESRCRKQFSVARNVHSSGRDCFLTRAHLTYTSPVTHTAGISRSPSTNTGYSEISLVSTIGETKRKLAGATDIQRKRNCHA